MESFYDQGDDVDPSGPAASDASRPAPHSPSPPQPAATAAKVRIDFAVATFLSESIWRAEQGCAER